VQRLSFIRHARDLGFPIDSIRELIKLQHQPGKDFAHVDMIARRQLAEVRQKLSQLEALEGELKRIIAACEGSNIASCKVLESLSDHALCLDTHDAKTMVNKIASTP